MESLLDPSHKWKAEEMSTWVPREGAEVDWNLEQYWIIAASKANLSVLKT